MTRRPHRKSRNGCVQCKWRHIKCDETHPACLLCISFEKRCSFLEDSQSSTASPRVHAASIISTPSSRFAVSIPSLAATESTVGLSPRPSQPPEQGILNMVHLDLLNDARNAMWNDDSFGLDPRTRSDVCEVVTGYALESPYLMHELLALSALHLSTLRPYQRLFLRHQATELQTHALSLFDAASDDNSIASIATRFIFASLLGHQVLYETLVFRPDDFSLFLEKFVSYLRLTRGVQLQIQGGNWQSLHDTGLRPLLEVGTKLPPENSASASECEALEALLKSADLGSSSIQVYLRALNQLKALFQLQRSTDPADIQSSKSLVFSWPVTVPMEFADLIMQRRPEALAILAHYAGLLHQNRHLWIVGDGGGYMVDSIANYLGSYWEPWLVWPRSLFAHTQTPISL